ncbi:hypothetical protein ACHAXR_000853 [Thalassiosira sp. AJA248-18]
MKLISAFAIIASAGSAVATNSNLREREHGDRNLSSQSKTIKVNFSSEAVSGEAYFTQAGGDENQLSGTWKVILTDFDTAMLGGCANGLNWHIHEKPVPTPGECGATGGHVDPTFGCGGASEYQKKKCDGSAATADNGDSCCKVIYGNEDYGCDNGDNIIKCEAGDQSGKLGPLKYQKDEDQVFEDAFTLNIDDIEQLSLVIHCGKPRVACGNFEAVSSSSSSD